MNKIRVKIEKIQNNQQLTIVTFSSKVHKLKMMSLELDSDITEAKELFLTTKASNIAIAKDFSGMISCANQLDVTIDSIEMGELLCSLELAFEDTLLQSIITADSAKRMGLKEKDRVTALIKSSDISILEVLA
jgi:molybdopterin-binding protein